MAQLGYKLGSTSIKQGPISLKNILIAVEVGHNLILTEKLANMIFWLPFCDFLFEKRVKSTQGNLVKEEEAIEIGRFFP